MSFFFFCNGMTSFMYFMIIAKQFSDPNGRLESHKNTLSVLIYRHFVEEAKGVLVLKALALPSSSPGRQGQKGIHLGALRARRTQQGMLKDLLAKRTSLGDKGHRVLIGSPLEALLLP